MTAGTWTPKASKSSATRRDPQERNHVCIAVYIAGVTADEEQTGQAQSRWDGARASDYDSAWKRMADQGNNPHGEADFVQRFSPASVLDAGCGTGRVAIELASRGVVAAGTDLDAQMLSVAQSKAPAIDWVQSDLAALDLQRTFDVVVMAGNIVLFVEPGTEAAVVAGAARHVGPAGHLIAGFSLNRGVSPEDWEAWGAVSGLAVTARHSTWNGDPFTTDSDYLVSVMTRS